MCFRSNLGLSAAKTRIQPGVKFIFKFRQLNGLDLPDCIDRYSLFCLFEWILLRIDIFFKTMVDWIMEEIRYNNLKSELFEQFGSVLGCSQQQATSNPVFFLCEKTWSWFCSQCDFLSIALVHNIWANYICQLCLPLFFAVLFGCYGWLKGLAVSLIRAT